MPLYRPTTGEILAIIQQGIDKHPQLRERYQRAAEILHNDHLDVVNGYWLCASQSRGAAAYSVNGSCDCADYRNAGAVVHGRIFCKHKLALEAYRRILEQHLAQRLIGNARFRSDLDRSHAAPHTYLLQLWDTNRLGSHLDSGRVPEPVCTFHWSQRGRALDDMQLAHFAAWLATARALPEPIVDTILADIDPHDYHAWRHHWFAIQD